MSAPLRPWAVTKTLHHSCGECFALTDGAIAIARASGSTGATAVTEGPGGIVQHSLTVVRAIQVVTR